ncbi:hypothetical protein M988_1985 [Hafnia paralvei ATCC 29927]|uniref:head-tail joining protein n=1 Tax=Hafnia paralvei TaxID=546367 RepID=UPI0007E30734|nr:hypothetical protein [Hafnia paralvei]OAT41361.1 hypothetical protein M988_1985 [Hafnia paralvei ATCC 29927]
MSVDWDKHLLQPLQGVFGEPVNWRPRDGSGNYDISGIFDRAYTQDVEPLNEDDPTVNTTNPVLGVRDVAFRSPPVQGDRLFLYREQRLYAVSDIQPDSHGGMKLILNRVKP